MRKLLLVSLFLGGAAGFEASACTQVEAHKAITKEWIGHEKGKWVGKLSWLPSSDRWIAEIMDSDSEYDRSRDPRISFRMDATCTKVEILGVNVSTR